MENHLRAATVIANLLDNRFNFFGIKFGFNGILGLIPGFGDFLVAVMSFYLVWIGMRMRLPSSALSQMIGNILTNFLIGLLPVVGDFVDFFHRSNLKNLKILKEHARNRVIEGEVVAAASPARYT